MAGLNGRCDFAYGGRTYQAQIFDGDVVVYPENRPAKYFGELKQVDTSTVLFKKKTVEGNQVVLVMDYKKTSKGFKINRNDQDRRTIFDCYYK